jgi:hypothetical protein
MLPGELGLPSTTRYEIQAADWGVAVAAIGGKLFAGHRWASEGALAVGAAGVADLQALRDAQFARSGLPTTASSEEGIPYHIGGGKRQPEVVTWDADMLMVEASTGSQFVAVLSADGESLAWEWIAWSPDEDDKIQRLTGKLDVWRRVHGVSKTAARRKKGRRKKKPARADARALSGRDGQRADYLADVAAAKAEAADAAADGSAHEPTRQIVAGETIVANEASSIVRPLGWGLRRDGQAVCRRPKPALNRAAVLSKVCILSFENV